LIAAEFEVTRETQMPKDAPKVNPLADQVANDAFVKDVQAWGIDAIVGEI
jgi:hypothetical protein